MSKRLKKIINTSFLILFLLGYIGTIVPGSIVASLFDLKVYAEDEEVTTETISSLNLVKSDITTTINSNGFIPDSWTYSNNFDCDEYEDPEEPQWFDENGTRIFSDTPLTDSHELYGHFFLNAMEIDTNEIYVFDEGLSAEDVLLNGSPVYSVRVFESPDVGYDGYNTGLEFVVKVTVNSSGGPSQVNTLNITGAVLDYEAGQNPEYSAGSEETNKYIVPMNGEVFVDSNNNPVTTFAAGNTYTYRLTIAPANSNYSITNASTIELNGTTYNLVYSGENQNATIDGNNVIFYGYTITIPEAPTPNYLNITIAGNPTYNGYGVFHFENGSNGSNGSLTIKINGRQWNGTLTNGVIQYEATEADIEVTATGYDANGDELDSVVQINGVTTKTAHINVDTTINVEFIPIVKYTLTLHPNGGTVPGGTSVNTKSGSVINLNSIDYTPTKNDYRFDGWYLNESLTGDPVTSITLNSDMDVYAKWTYLKGDINVIFDSPAGLNNIVYQNQAITTGATLNGYIDSSKQNIFVLNPQSGYRIALVEISNDENVTTYAGPGEYNQPLELTLNGSPFYSFTISMEQQPVQTVTLTFETNGGTTINPITVNLDSVVDLTKYTTTREGYRFDGWYLNSSFNGDPKTSVTMTNSRSVYAKWTQTYGSVTITHDNPDGLSSIKFNNNTLNGNSSNGYLLNTDNNTFTITPSENYSIGSVEVTNAKGQTTAYGNFPVEGIAEFTVTGSTSYTLRIITVESTPQPVLQTLTFETNGGTPIEAVTANYGDTITLSNYETTKTNHRFVGWYDNINLSGNAITSITMNDNKTVYAKWLDLKGNVTVTHNHANGIQSVLLNGEDTNNTTVYAWIDTEYTNTIKVNVQENYRIKTIRIDDVNGEVFTRDQAYNYGESPEISVNGSSQYTLTITTEQQPQITTYTLSFETGFETHWDPETITAGETVDLTTYTIDRGGYRFDGWYDNNEFNGNPITSILMNSNKTVYAKWTAIEGNITITYNNHDAIGAISLNSHTLMSNGGTVEGYVIDYNNLKNQITVSLVPNLGYTIGNIEVTDHEGKKTNSGPGPINGNVTIEVTGSTSYNLNITIIAPLERYSINNDGLHGLLSSSTEGEITEGNDYETTLSIHPDYEAPAGSVGLILPKAVIVQIGENILDKNQYTYNSQTGHLLIPANVINGNIAITAYALAKINKPVANTTEYIYSAKEIGLDVTNADQRFMDITGNDKATNVGNYSVTYTLNDSTYIWTDETAEPITINWSIAKAHITPEPSITMQGWSEDEDPSNPVINNLPEGITYIVEYKQKDAPDTSYVQTKPTTRGNYIVRLSYEETQNYYGGVATYEFTILRNSHIVEVALPRVLNNKYFYTGEEITVEDQYDSEMITRSGEKATNVGVYHVKYHLNNQDYVWADESTGDKEIKWSIGLNTPTNVTNSYTYNSITLKWNSVLGAQEYQVYECKSNNTSCKKITTATTNQAKIKSLAFNSTHYYKVRAVTKVDGTTYNSSYTDLRKTVAKLNAPTNLKASKNRYQEVKVTWTKVAGAQRYYVERCKKDGTSCKKLGYVTTNSYVDKKGSKGKTYLYKVRAYRSGKYSGYSTAEGLRLKDSISLTINKVGYQKNELSIKYLEGAYKYQIQKSTNNRTWTDLKVVELDKNNLPTEGELVVNDTKAKFNTKIYYRVRAYRANYTPYTSANAKNTYLDKPVITASRDRYQEVKLTWDAVKGAEKYYVYSCDSNGANCKELGNTTKTTYSNKKAAIEKYSYYKVAAYKKGKYSKKSALKSGYRLNDDLTVAVKSHGYLVNRITINVKEGATKYQIEKSLDNKTFEMVDTFEYTGAESFFTTDDEDEILYGKTYYYRVRAHNGKNWTKYTTVSVLVSKLRQPTATATGTAYSPVIKVNKVPKADGYEFYHSTDGETWTKEQKSTSLTFKKTYDENDKHYYRVRAYKVIKNKTYYSNYVEITYASNSNN